MKAIAILGFGTECKTENLKIAFQCGELLACYNFITSAGGIGWTFHHAFKGVKKNNGRTLAILTNDSQHSEFEYIDNVIFTETTSDKHDLIVQNSFGAIVIGGGEGSATLIDKFLFQNKPVVMISGTGGITESINYQSIEHITVDKIELSSICLTD